MSAPHVDVFDRLRAKLRLGDGGCWLWTAGRDRDGYGRFWLNGRDVPAHRVAWELFAGPIPAGLIAMHTVCDTPSCCNPSHLSLGTHLDNARDREAKGRGRLPPVKVAAPRLACTACGKALGKNARHRGALWCRRCCSRQAWAVASEAERRRRTEAWSKAGVRARVGARGVGWVPTTEAGKPDAIGHRESGSGRMRGVI